MAVCSPLPKLSTPALTWDAPPLQLPAELIREIEEREETEEDWIDFTKDKIAQQAQSMHEKTCRSVRSIIVNAHLFTFEGYNGHFKCRPLLTTNTLIEDIAALDLASTL